MFSGEIFENFKNIYFKEHVRTTASKRLRKISPLLVLGKAMLDGKLHNWATNVFYWKYKRIKLACAMFTLYQNAFCYFFQASEESKSDNNNDFKVSWATYCSRTILRAINQQNEIFVIRIFSHPLNFLNFHLISVIYLYTQGKSSPKIPPPRHISSLSPLTGIY